MPRKSCHISRPDVTAMWNLLLRLGEKPVALKVHPDGTFRILTEKCLKESGSSTINPNEWDVVLQ